MSFLLTCPHCGEARPVEEFRCSGEITSRPKSDPSLRELTTYIYFRENVAGVHREWWFHRACESWFIAERDTTTNEVASVEIPG
jgi:heterotetrameric sarcosine oxidase delta subunit